MGLESATYVDGLVVSNPVGSDDLDEGDDHIRLIKSTIKASFPNIAGAVNAGHADLAAMGDGFATIVPGTGITLATNPGFLRKGVDGLVVMSLHISNPTGVAQALLATLPVGFRPTVNMVLSIAAALNDGTTLGDSHRTVAVSIFTNGQISIGSQIDGRTPAISSLNGSSSLYVSAAFPTR